MKNYQQDRRRPYTRKSASRTQGPISHSCSLLRSAVFRFLMGISADRDGRLKLGLRWTIDVELGMFPVYISRCTLCAVDTHDSNVGERNVLRARAIVGV